MNRTIPQTIFSILLAVLLLAGANGELHAAPRPQEENPPTADSESTIGRIKARDNLMIVGVKYDFEPFGFLNEEGQVQGFDIDIVQAIADFWGIEVQFVPVTSSDRIEKLAAGEVDLVAASMTHKKERDESIDFSQTYFLDGQSLLVRQDSGIESIEDLGGRTVAAIQGSTSIDQIRSAGERLGVELEVLPFQEYPPGLAALINGQVDALTTDSVALSQFAKQSPELIVVGGRFTQEPYGMGIRAGDSEFRNLIDFTLQELKEDGTYDELYRKWFGDDEPYPIEVLPGDSPFSFADGAATFPTADSRVEQILARGRILAGVKYDFEPFGYLGEEGQVQGFDIDIVREFAARWLGDRTAVELVPVTSSDRIEKLAAGEVDLVAASMTHRKERDETIDFSQTYFLDGQSLLVRQDSGIENIGQLGGRTVAAIQGSTSIDQIRSAGEILGIDIEILPFQEYPPGLAALINGQVDALTTDSVALSQFAKQSPELIVVGGRFTKEPYGIGVPNNDHRFRDLVNFTLQEMKQDGTYDRIYRKWFGADQPYPVEIWPGRTYLDVNTSSDLVLTLLTLIDETRANPQLPEAESPEESSPVPLAAPTPGSDSVPTPVAEVPSSSERIAELLETVSEREYVVRDGDSLTGIAARIYGNQFWWSLIYQANREDIGDDPNVLLVGARLLLPALPQ